jgi:beta-glucosidase
MHTRSFLALAVLAASLHAQSTPPYKNPQLPVEQRVRDLLSRMNNEEKARQLIAIWEDPSAPDQNKMFVNGSGKFVPESAKTLDGGIGEVAHASDHHEVRDLAEYINEVQRYIIAHNRFGIPAIFHEECLHGHAAAGSTEFPVPIGLGSSWNPDLVRDVFDATGREVRSKGAHQCLTPVLDLGREPRWGRTEETYGEDPYLVTKMSSAAIIGMQGGATGIIDGQHVIATAKHFAAHGQPESGTNTGPVNVSESILRDAFFVPFEHAVRDAHVGSVMPSYNEINGVPSHSNVWLLDSVLRKEWGFAGYIVSDYSGIEQLHSLHFVAPDLDTAAVQAMRAGVDIELPNAAAYTRLPELVSNGKISQQQLDTAVSRVLAAKFALGLFEHPFADPDAATRITHSEEHRQLALRAARESIILLKNADSLLPLDRTKIHRIAVIGPNAGQVHLGGYSEPKQVGVSVLEGIRNKLGSSAEVVHAEGCRITENEPDWYQDAAVPPDPKKDEQRMQEAVRVSQNADVIVAVVGENEATSREAWSPTHPGDRDNLDLIGRQDELVQRLIATGKPVIVVLLHGRPNSINYIAEHARAILDGWYAGEEGGNAIADVIFGDVNPSGKLPITIPRTVGQLPDYYYQKPSARRGYLWSDKSPLFAFGYGLSYTTFRYGAPQLAATQIAPNGSTTLSVEVTNTGSRAGEETAQMYIRDRYSSVTRPIEELRGFQKIALQPGETKRVTFQIAPESLAFHNRDNRFVVEPGAFDIFVGPDSVKHQRICLQVQGPVPPEDTCNSK